MSNHLQTTRGTVGICVSVVATDHKGIIKQMKKAKKSHADLVEWRIDAYENVADITSVISLLKEIKEILKKKPLLFTYRSKQEGGFGKISIAEYTQLLKTVILSKLIDIVDVELLLGDSIVRSIIHHAKISDVKVLVSNHDLDSTPRKEVLINRFKIMQEKGADAVKIACTPKDDNDVTVLEEASKAMKQSSVPIIAISMGELGQRTRVHAQEIGSSLTFATLDETNALGQLNVEELYQILNQKEAE